MNASMQSIDDHANATSGGTEMQEDGRDHKSTKRQDRREGLKPGKTSGKRLSWDLPGFKQAWKFLCNRYYPGDIFVILLTAFLLTTIINMLTIEMSFSELAFAREVDVPGSLFRFILLALYLAIVQATLSRKRLMRLSLMIVAGVFALLNIVKSPGDFYINLGIIVIMGFFIYGVYQDDANDPRERGIELSNRTTYILLTLSFLAMFLAVAIATVYRFWGFNASTYDFGIFAQMFEYMATTGRPLTTVERGTLLSHFAIHFSPIYYLLFPGYLIFRTPEYLLVMQGLFIAAAVFPLALICRHFKLSNRITLLISLVYLFFPGVIAPAFYDFHENKFLPFLLLWMFYFFEKKKWLPMALFMVLALFVKEDAALYVICIGLYYTFARKQYRPGLLVAAIGGVYFIATITLMTRFGHGIMDGRFGLYHLPEEAGLFPVLRNIVTNPGFWVRSLFSEEKFRFLVYLMGPLLFLPLAVRNVKSLILLLPMVVINLMTTYPYQFDIGFQYSYGVSALLFFLFISNLHRFSPQWRQILCVMAVFTSMSLFLMTTGRNFTSYPRHYLAHREAIVQSEEVLARVPRDASVTAETFFVPHLYQVKTLYMYPSSNTTTLMVMDNRQIHEGDRQQVLDEGNYQLIDEGGFILVYERMDP